MSKLRRFLDYIDNINDWAGVPAWVLIPVLMLVVTYEVVARYVFDSPTTWGFETDRFLLIIIVTLGGGWTFLHRGHVNVDIVYSRFNTRWKAIIDVITFVVIFSVMGVLLREFTSMAIQLVKVKEVTESIWAPAVYPIKMIAVLGIFLCFLQCFAKFIRDCITAVTGRPEKKKYLGMFEKEEA